MLWASLTRYAHRTGPRTEIRDEVDPSWVTGITCVAHRTLSRRREPLGSGLPRLELVSEFIAS